MVDRESCPWIATPIPATGRRWIARVLLLCLGTFGVASARLGLAAETDLIGWATVGVGTSGGGEGPVFDVSNADLCRLRRTPAPLRQETNRDRDDRVKHLMLSRILKEPRLDL